MLKIKIFNLVFFMLVSLLFSINSYSTDIEVLDKNIEQNWIDKYSKEKAIVINNQIKESFLNLNRMQAMLYGVQNDLSKIIGAEFNKQKNKEKYNKDMLDGFISLQNECSDLPQRIGKVSSLFNLLLLMRSDEDRKILSWHLRLEIKSELDSIKNLGGVRESDFSTTYSTFNSDPVFDIYKGKCIKFKKVYYSWLQANSSI
jgi:hypothetical protein